MKCVHESSGALSLRVVRRGDPVVGQGVVHVVRTHLVQGGIPDGVLFGEQVCKVLYRREESSENEAEFKCVDFINVFTRSSQVTRAVQCHNSSICKSLRQTFFRLPEN